MVKESPKKKSVKVKIKKEDLIIENFVGLQRAMTNLSIKFENLSDNLSRLLEILELSAKNYLEKEAPKESNSPALLKQINLLIDQNKALAEGLLLIDDTLRKKQQKEENSKENPTQPKIHARPLPKNS
jgi:hypothetical protein